MTVIEVEVDVSRELIAGTLREWPPGAAVQVAILAALDADDQSPRPSDAWVGHRASRPIDAPDWDAVVMYDGDSDHPPSAAVYELPREVGRWLSDRCAATDPDSPRARLPPIRFRLGAPVRTSRGEQTA